MSANHRDRNSRKRLEGQPEIDAATAFRPVTADCFRTMGIAILPVPIDIRQVDMLS
jgi:hypothetical protein